MMGRMLVETMRCALLKLASMSCRQRVMDCSRCSNSSVRLKLREASCRDMAVVECHVVYGAACGVPCDSPHLLRLHACKRHEDALAVGSSSANLPQLFPACSSPTPLPLIDLQLLRVLTLPWKAFVTRMAWQLLPLSRAGNAGELTLPIAANAPPLSLHQGRLSLSSISFPCSPSHILLVIT